MSFRKIKLRLYQSDPHCYWCGRITTLTKGHVNGHDCLSQATVDHIYSKFNPKRWVKGHDRKVIACYECNHARAVIEESQIPVEELQRRSLGFKFNYNSLFPETCETLEEVMERLRENGLDDLTVIPFEDVEPLLKETLTTEKAGVS